MLLLIQEIYMRKMKYFIALKTNLHPYCGGQTERGGWVVDVGRLIEQP